MRSLTRGKRGSKTQVLGSHHPAAPFSKTLRPVGRWSTHLDFIPVVSVLLQHSGRVEWSLGHHHRLLEGAPSPWIRPCRHLGQHRLPPTPTPFFRAPVGNPRLRVVKEPDATRSKGRALPHICGPPQGLWSHQPLRQPCSSSSPGLPRTRRHSR